MAYLLPTFSEFVHEVLQVLVEIRFGAWLVNPVMDLQDICGLSPRRRISMFPILELLALPTLLVDYPSEVNRHVSVLPGMWILVDKDGFQDFA